MTKESGAVVRSLQKGDIGERLVLYKMQPKDPYRKSETQKHHAIKREENLRKPGFPLAAACFKVAFYIQVYLESYNMYCEDFRGV